MSFHTNPKDLRSSQIATVDHRMLALAPAVRRDLALYLHAELDIVQLEDGPIDVVFERNDGSLRRYAFAFRAGTSSGKRLAIAVDDEAYALEHDLDSYLQELQQRLPPAVADEIYLLTERGLSDLLGVSGGH